MNLVKTSPLRERLLVKGELLCQFLNVAEGLVKQRKVLELVGYLRELQQLLPTIVQGKPAGRVPRTSTLLYDLADNQEASRLAASINRALTRYRFRRRVDRYLLVDDDELPSLQISSAPIRLVAFAKAEQASTIEMTYAVELVLELAEQGGLDRVLRCPVCHKWFMANRTDQLYCTAKCSREKYRQEHKPELRAYMKKYRKEHPNRER